MRAVKNKDISSIFHRTPSGYCISLNIFPKQNLTFERNIRNDTFKKGFFGFFYREILR